MIKVSQLRVRYGRQRALDGLDLEVAEGESLLLAGANGSGKTTLLRVLADVLRPDGGSVRIAGASRGPDRRSAVAYLPTSSSFYDDLTVRDAKRWHAAFHPVFRWPSGPALEIGEGRRVGALSRGEKTLFLLGLALATSPRCLLIDDVLHFLDPHRREIFIQAVLARIAEERLTLVIASHSAADIEGLVERVAVLESGRVRLAESLEQLKRRFVKAYADHPPPGLPVVCRREWQGTNEIYLYPYDPGRHGGLDVRHLTLAEILRAFIGGDDAGH